MGYYFGFIVLCFGFIFLLIQKIFNYYLDEFGIDKTLPLTTDLIEEVFNLIIENKVCGKFKKSVPPSVDIYSIETLYFILSCAVCVLLGFICGIRKNKKNIYSIGRNIHDINNYFSNSDDNNPSTCSLCLNLFQPRMVLLPCKHICICSNCWILFYQRSQYFCPICRQNIEGIMDVYCT